MSERAPDESPVAPALTVEQARLLPFYHDLRNEIVEPDRVVVSSQYFWTCWAPRLGPTLTALVVCLRRHCYYNKLTQERRDWCFPEQATLAREIGVESTKTIRAAFQHPLAAYFVRREARYVYDPHRGKKIRTSDMYYVAMDDPLTPEDEALLVARAAERLLREGRGSEIGLEGRAVPPIGTKRPQVSRQSNGQKRRQVPIGRLDRQDSPVISTPEVVHETSTHDECHSMVQSVRGVEGAERSSMIEEVPPASAETPDPTEKTAVAASFEVFPGLGLQSRPVWRMIRDEVSRQTRAPTDRILLAQSELLAREGDTLFIGLPGRSAVQRAVLRLRQPLLEAARVILGRPVGLEMVNAIEWNASIEG